MPASCSNCPQRKHAMPRQRLGFGVRKLHMEQSQRISMCEYGDADIALRAAVSKVAAVDLRARRLAPARLPRPQAATGFRRMAIFEPMSPQAMTVSMMLRELVIMQSAPLVPGASRE